MAFDRPLEADKVEEDNFLLSLVRGPILGGIMWILGDDDDEKEQETKLQQGLKDMILDDDDDDNRGETNPHKSLPRLVHSDLSVAMESAGESNSNNGFLRSTCSGSVCRQATEKKKMSWSENLVEYMGDESVRHEPPSSSNGSSPAMSKPIKSAMTRSSSVRSHPLGMASEEKERKIRYLPNGLDRAHNGLIMPTRPMGMGGVGNDLHGSGGNEGLSPQWGWYINTTPPTPEMYHSRSSLKHADKTSHSAASSFSSTEASVNPAAASRGPNRVFQGLKAGSNRPAVGWPSVPL